ncbi:hypothetical protein LAZ67_12001925, partial [Cordylochernes scorpioides]
MEEILKAIQAQNQAMQAQTQALQVQNQETREALQAQTQALQAQNQETREALNQEISSVKEEMKEEISSVKEEMKEEISSVKEEMKDEISSVKKEMKDKISALEERFAAVETGHPRTPVFQQENNNSGRPLVKVPTFDGQSSWTSFKTQFDVVAQANGWNVRDKASFLAAALRGPAVDVLQMIPEQLRLDFNPLIDVQDSRYGEEHYQQLHVVKFKNRLQEKKESLQDLANDIRRLSRLAFRTYPSETQDFMAQQQFIDAIGDPETQKFARLSSATTLQETLVQAMKHEATQQASRGSYHVARQVKLDNPEREKGRCWTCGANDHILWQFNVMPFGLCNAPATFERLMEAILQGLATETCMVYLDDIIVLGKNFEEHLSNIKKVFKRLEAANLKLSPKKCKLFKKEVAYLRHIISAEGVQTDPEKTETVRKWPTPKDLTQLRSFLGLCTYYRRFIPGFSNIARPLHRLTESGRPFVWTPDCQRAMEKLKEMLVAAPILAYPRPGYSFILDTDASNTGIGGVLSQVQEGSEKVITYFSKTLSRPERNYCVTRKELLAIVKSIEHFHHYLYGQEFILRSDHASLQWLLNFKKLEGQLARWIQRLQEYQVKIQHRPGKRHQNADALSRGPCVPQCEHCARAEDKYGIRQVAVQESDEIEEQHWTGQALRKAQHDKEQKESKRQAQLAGRKTKLKLQYRQCGARSRDVWNKKKQPPIAFIAEQREEYDKRSSVTFIVDSGSTCHMVNEEKLLDHQKKRDVDINVAKKEEGKLTNEMTSVIQPRYREDLDSEIEESQDTKMELDTHDKPQNSTNSKYMLRNRENINRPERLKDYEVLNSVSEEIGLLTYNEAVTGVDKENWVKAIQEEKDSLKLDAKQVTTPIVEGALKIDPILENKSEGNFPYREAVGSLLYLANKIRPDVAYAVGYESRSMHEPTNQDIQNVKRTMRYLKQTKTYGLHYSKQDEDMERIAYCDSDFAGDMKTRKSTSGYTILFGKGPISWSSRKQPIVALSTTEAEYIAAAECVKELIYIKALIEELTNETILAKLNIDNQSAMTLMKTGQMNRKTKHIDQQNSADQDKKTGLRFLVDSGADVSLIPAKSEDKKQAELKLYAANGTKIDTYEMKKHHQDNLGIYNIYLNSLQNLNMLMEKSNIVADTLSRIEEVSMIDYNEIALKQINDTELFSLKQQTNHKFQQYPLPSGKVLWGETSTNNIRPYIPKDFRKRIFLQIHGALHPGIRSSVKQMKTKFLWTNIKKDVQEWARTCVACQRNKITRHTKSKIGCFPENRDRFCMVHIDCIGPLPPSNDHIYCLTCIDRFTGWPEVIPLKNIKADTLAQAFYERWISRFGMPSTIITDCAKQFSSTVFQNLAFLCGVKIQHTTPYHPQSNGNIERFHRTIKTAIRAHNSLRWTDTLPTVLLGFRAALREDMDFSAAELVYGVNIKLPGEFFENPRITAPSNTFVDDLRRFFRDLKPKVSSQTSSRAIFIHKDMNTCSHVFLRIDRVKKSLEPPYQGPYRILERHDKYFVLDINGRNASISIDRLKLAYLPSADCNTDTVKSTPFLPNDVGTSRFGRTIRRPVRFMDCV